MKDWSEARAYTASPVIIIAFSEPEIHVAKFAADANMRVINYREIETLETLYARPAPKSVADELVFSGAVDGFDSRSRLSGWVMMRGPSGLVGGLSLKVMLEGSEIAIAVPTQPRFAVTGSPDYLASFSVDCSGSVSKADIVGGNLKVTALHNSTDRTYNVPIWSKLILELRKSLAGGS